MTETEVKRERALARVLAANGSPLDLDIQRVFALLPPEEPLGEALFRLVEAFPRTPEPGNRRALVDEFLHHAMPMLPVDLGTKLIGRQFVYAETIEEALSRAQRTARDGYSFDMLAEGARSAQDAARNFQRYRGAIEAAAAAGSRFGVSIKLSSILPCSDFYRADRGGAGRGE